jgi:4-hydroxybutyrate CoA-transferase
MLKSINSKLKASDAINNIKSGDKIFLHGAAATPFSLVELLVARASELQDVTIYHLHTEGPVAYAQKKYSSAFKIRNLFVGANIRNEIDFDRIDYIPCFLSEIPMLFKNKKIKLDYAFIQTSAPDEHGYVSLGTSVDVAKSAALSATTVVAEINHQMPRTFGDGLLSLDQIHAVQERNHPVYEVHSASLSLEEMQIGKYVASIIEDGSCLQLGIGSIPNAVLSQLSGHKNLGLHTEMCSDGVLQLFESGAINNSKKNFHQGKSVASFIIGTKKLYDFVNNNPTFFLLEADYVNNPRIIARNDRVISINSAVEIDLTGQVCADSIGSKIISGVGGQIDFIRGASLSNGGKPVIALTSRSKKGNPRIVTFLKQGAGVVTTRAHIHYVVTEYGIADLYGKSLGERAKELIQIAHPEDRENLAIEWQTHWKKNY